MKIAWDSDGFSHICRLSHAAVASTSPGLRRFIAELSSQLAEEASGHGFWRWKCGKWIWNLYTSGW